MLHGVETITATTPNGSINIVKTAVAFLVGISPDGPTQALTMCLNEKDDAQFGPATPANDIAFSLAIMRKVAASQKLPGGSFPVIVVNVFDATKHTADLTAVTGTVTNKKIALKKHLYGTIVVKKTSDSSTVSDTKYTIDEWGTFTDITPTGELENIGLTFTGKYVIPAAAADIVGAVDTNNVRTGMKMAGLCWAQFKFNPKIILCPKYATLSAVYTEGRAIADAMRGVWLHDCATGDTVTDALANRGSSGTIGWNTTHKRSYLLYPWLTTNNAYEATANGTSEAFVAFPYSAFMAGCMAKSDADDERGYWTSPSNMEINGAVTGETLITTSFNDANAENQLLNSAGITTYLNNDGLRTYGNRMASYPSPGGANSFINLVRVDDIVAESMEIAWSKKNDVNITQAFIDITKEDGNAMVASLIQRGAFLPGSEIQYNASDNPTADLADGKVKFKRRWMTGTPAENIGIISEMDINLLSFK